MTGDDALDLLDLCYRSVDEPEGWQELLEAMARKFKADAGDFVLEDYTAGVALAFASTGFDPVFRDNYDDEFLGENGWINGLMAMPPGRVFGTHLEPDDFTQSVYYNEWLRPQGLRYGMGTLMEYSQRHAVQIALVRQQKNKDYFNSEEIALLERIMPHMRRAWKLQGRLRLADDAWRPLEAAVTAMNVPALLADQSGKVVFVNAAAENFLSRREDFRLSGGRLSLEDHDGEKALKTAIAAACCLARLASEDRRSEIAVRTRDQDAPRIIVEVVPLRSVGASQFRMSRCLLLLIDPSDMTQHPEGRLRSVWDLTPTEEALAYSLSAGMTTSAFARQTGTSVGTVRWHLKNIQAKMDAETSAAVVAKVNSALRRV